MYTNGGASYVVTQRKTIDDCILSRQVCRVYVICSQQLNMCCLVVYWHTSKWQHWGCLMLVAINNNILLFLPVESFHSRHFNLGKTRLCFSKKINARLNFPRRSSQYSCITVNVSCVERRIKYVSSSQWICWQLLFVCCQLQYFWIFIRSE